MNTTSLETFLVLSKIRNFTKASEALFVAQSTVTNRIAELEKNWDSHYLSAAQGA